MQQYEVKMQDYYAVLCFQLHVTGKPVYALSLLEAEAEAEADAEPEADAETEAELEAEGVVPAVRVTVVVPETVVVPLGTPMHSQALLTSDLPLQTPVTEGGRAVVVVESSAPRLVAAPEALLEGPSSTLVDLSPPPRPPRATITVLELSSLLRVAEAEALLSSPERDAELETLDEAEAERDTKTVEVVW